jgi:hypothetical protein
MVMTSPVSALLDLSICLFICLPLLSATDAPTAYIDETYTTMWVSSPSTPRATAGTIIFVKAMMMAVTMPRIIKYSVTV